MKYRVGDVITFILSKDIVLENLSAKKVYRGEILALLSPVAYLTLLENGKVIYVYPKEIIEEDEFYV